MAHSATLRPFGFSQPTRVTMKAKKRPDTPIPSDDSENTARTSRDLSYHKSKSRRVSLSSDSSGPYWATPSPPQSRATAMRSGMSQRTFPDEEDEETFRSSRAPRTHEKRRPARLQTSCHALHPSIASPLTPTAVRMLAEMQLRTPSFDLSAAPEDFTERQLEQQLKDIYLALRRVEDEREKVQSQMQAGRADRRRIERELAETRRENQRLAARLEEMLRHRSPTRKSPVSARSDDAWGCSMYDME